MLLRKLRCAFFKNYTAIALDFADELNFIVGPNGAGKTTLLDAIHYLSLTKSALNTIDVQNILHGQEAFAVEGQFVKQDKTYAVHCVVKKQQGKLFKVNQQPYEKLREHIGLFPVVLTTPYDLDLVRGGSEGRRRFFDTILCQIDASYLATLAKYQRLLQQRNSLLRLHKVEGYLDQDLLNTYDQQLLPLGQWLFEARKAFLHQFAKYFQVHYRYFVAAKETVQLVYSSMLEAPDFAQQFADNLPQDLALQRTVMGVHRDDVNFTLNGYPLKKVGSQGQQKSFVIALRLAQFDSLQASLQLKPLLLLDDIFDKLDEQRIHGLVQLIAQQYFGQIFVTDASGQRGTSLLRSTQSAYRHIQIEHGKLIDK